MKAENTIYFVVWWVWFEYGSFDHFLERFFSRFSGFLFSLKINISKFQFDFESEGHRFSLSSLISLFCYRSTEILQGNER